LLNEKGEFLSALDGMKVLEIAASEDFNFTSNNLTGSLELDENLGEETYWSDTCLKTCWYKSN